jgi:hypothetical protein
VRLLATPGADAGISSVRMAYRQVNQKKLAPPALPFCSLTSPHELETLYEYGGAGRRFFGAVIWMVDSRCWMVVWDGGA